MSYDPNAPHNDRPMPPRPDVPPMPPPVDSYQRAAASRDARVERESGGLTWLVVVLLVIAVVAALYFLWGPGDTATTTGAPATVEQTAPVVTDTAPAAPATDAAPATTAPAETAPAN